MRECALSRIQPANSVKHADIARRLLKIAEEEKEKKDSKRKSTGNLREALRSGALFTGAALGAAGGSLGSVFLWDEIIRLLSKTGVINPYKLFYSSLGLSVPLALATGGLTGYGSMSAIDAFLNLFEKRRKKEDNQGKENKEEKAARLYARRLYKLAEEKDKKEGKKKEEESTLYEDLAAALALPTGVILGGVLPVTPVYGFLNSTLGMSEDPAAWFSLGLGSVTAPFGAYYLHKLVNALIARRRKKKSENEEAKSATFRSNLVKSAQEEESSDEKPPKALQAAALLTGALLGGGLAVLPLPYIATLLQIPNFYGEEVATYENIWPPGSRTAAFGLGGLGGLAAANALLNLLYRRRKKKESSSDNTKEGVARLPNLAYKSMLKKAEEKEESSDESDEKEEKRKKFRTDLTKVLFVPPAFFLGGALNEYLLRRPLRSAFLRAFGEPYEGKLYFTRGGHQAFGYTISMLDLLAGLLSAYGVNKLIDRLHATSK